MHTMTPRSVAAGMSTLSRPTPARPTIFRLGAASRTSRSTVVALRTNSASASATAARSSGRLGPSTQRTSTLSPKASTVDWASLSAISTTGWLTSFMLLKASFVVCIASAIPAQSLAGRLAKAGAGVNGWGDQIKALGPSSPPLRSDSLTSRTAVESIAYSTMPISRSRRSAKNSMA